MKIGMKCYECGTVLEERNINYMSYSEVRIVPCHPCIESAKGDAYISGHKEGYDQGKEEGHDNGYVAGQASIRDDVREMLKTVGEEIDRVEAVKDIA